MRRRMGAIRSILNIKYKKNLCRLDVFNCQPKDALKRCTIQNLIKTPLKRDKPTRYTCKHAQCVNICCKMSLSLKSN